jgi:hypothetical protein
MINNSNQCPIKEFAELLQKQQQSADNNEIIGSTLQVHSENNIWANAKNLLFTDWLRLKIYFHNRSKCPSCSQEKKS